MQLVKYLVSRLEDTGENSVLTVLCDGLVGLYGNIVYCTAVLKLFIFGLLWDGTLCQPSPGCVFLSVF